MVDIPRLLACHIAGLQQQLASAKAEAEPRTASTAVQVAHGVPMLLCRPTAQSFTVLLLPSIHVCVQVRRAQQSNQNGGTSSNRPTPGSSAAGSKSGSPAASTEDPTSSSSSSGNPPSILPSFQLLPSVGATGVQLLQQLRGEGSQPQPQQMGGDPSGKAGAAGAGGEGDDLGGTAVTAQPLGERAPSPVAQKNGRK
jgi:hypothetical protein